MLAVAINFPKGVRQQFDNFIFRFGERLRELRESPGLSQAAFAHSAVLDRTYISGIELGRRNVSIRNIEKLARALGISISELTGGI